MIQQFQFLKPVFDKFTQADYELWLVGGCVRDHHLGIPCKDFDLTTNALPEIVMAILRELGARVIEKNGGNYGTVACVFEGQDVEITTYRVDKDYPMGDRRPVVEFSAELSDDLMRRDFTINAIAMDLSGTLPPTFEAAGGMCDRHMTDLWDRVLSSPQDPNKLFADDPLRILRMYRFTHRFSMKVDDRLRMAARRYATSLKFLSRERIQQELIKIASGPKPHLAFREMMEDGVMHQIFPQLALQVGYDQDNEWHHLPLWEHTLQAVKVVYQMSGQFGLLRPDYRVVLAMLLHDIAKPSCTQQRWRCPQCQKRIPIEQKYCPRCPDIILDPHAIGLPAPVPAGRSYKGHGYKGAQMARTALESLRFGADDVETIYKLIDWHDNFYEVQWNERNIRRYLHKTGSLWQKMVLVLAADRMAHAPENLRGTGERGDDASEYFELYDKALNLPARDEVLDIKPAIDGHTVMALTGMTPGPALGRVMTELKRLAIDGEILTYDQAVAWLATRE